VKSAAHDAARSLPGTTAVPEQNEAEIIRHITEVP
jgi:hypothetical protein